MARVRVSVDAAMAQVQALAVEGRHTLARVNREVIDPLIDGRKGLRIELELSGLAAQAGATGLASLLASLLGTLVAKVWLLETGSTELEAVPCLRPETLSIDL